METQNAFLSEPARQALRGYAAEAEQAWRSGGRMGLDRWVTAMHQRERGWVGVLDLNLRPLDSASLDPQIMQRLTRLRGVDWPMSRRSVEQPWLRIPFPGAPEQGMLVIELPQRFNPGQYRMLWRIVTNGIIPGLFTLLLCVGLYRMLIVPLNQLREQANAWRAPPHSAPRAPTAGRRASIHAPSPGMTSWANWPEPSTRWPSGCRAR
jgi:two-component system sensor histidine kinase PfeS